MSKEIIQNLDQIYSLCKEIKHSILSLETDVRGIQKDIDLIKNFTRTNCSAPSHEKHLQTNTVAHEDSVPQQNAAAPVEKRGKDVFFLPSPTRGGSFDHKGAKSEFILQDSLYRFERPNYGAERANVFVHEDESVVAIFTNNPDAQSGACEAVSGTRQKATKIKTIEPGIALFDSVSNKWQIETKVRIEYHVN